MNKEFNPLVSIIIPVYNGANYLAEAIDSALAQTYKNIEVIVVNDGSNDDGRTRTVAQRYGDRIRYFEKENGGVSTAFNFGIRKMNGEYFSWLSHDDKYLPFKVEKQINFLSQLSDKKIVLFSDRQTIDSTSAVIRTTSIKFNDDELLELFMIYKRPFINGNTILIPAEAFAVVGYFNEDLKYTQDYDLWFRLQKKYQFRFIDEPLIQSRRHPTQGSITDHTERDSKIKEDYSRNSNIEKLTAELNHKNAYQTILYFCLYCYAQGGERNQYPINFWCKRLMKTSKNRMGVNISIILTQILKKTQNLPNKIRRNAVCLIFRLSKSKMIKLL